MTTEIVAPTKSQGGTQGEKESGGDKGSDGLAESFGAARRDLEGTETVEPRNMDDVRKHWQEVFAGLGHRDLEGTDTIEPRNMDDVRKHWQEVFAGLRHG